jgi:hypothetical protein
MANLEGVKKIKLKDGTIMYYLNGKPHNWEEPAIIHPNGKKEYWLFGFQYTKDEFIERKRDTNGIPPAKDPKYDTRF